MSDNSENLNKLNDILAKAKAKGASDASAGIFGSKSLSASVRMGNLESIDNSTTYDFSIDVYKGKKKGSASAASLRPEHLEMALEEALFNADNSTEDPYAGLADAAQLSSSYPNVDLFDPSVPTVEELADRARAAEDTALQGDKIVNSHGGGASWGVTSVAVMASNNFSGAYERSSNSTSVSVIAGENGEQVDDYDYSSTVYAGDLKDPKEIGEEAAQRAAQGLGSRKVDSGKYPVVFDPRISGRLIGEFISAIKGNAVAKNQTFLRGKLGQQVFANNISLIDDPLMNRGLGSRPFDYAGIAASKQALVENGVLQSLILSLYSARELSDKTGQPFATTGHNGVGLNLYMDGGSVTPEELMADIKDGFYVTGLLGHGGNTLTGDYSQGANGLWIRNGKPEFAVSEVTIAGTLAEIFANVTAANDVDRKKSSMAIPTLRVEGMTIGGKKLEP